MKWEIEDEELVKGRINIYVYRQFGGLRTHQKFGGLRIHRQGDDVWVWEVCRKVCKGRYVVLEEGKTKTRASARRNALANSPSKFKGSTWRPLQATVSVKGCGGRICENDREFGWTDPNERFDWWAYDKEWDVIGKGYAATMREAKAKIRASIATYCKKGAKV